MTLRQNEIADSAITTEKLKESPESSKPSPKHTTGYSYPLVVFIAFLAIILPIYFHSSPNPYIPTIIRQNDLLCKSILTSTYTATTTATVKLTATTTTTEIYTATVTPKPHENLALCPSAPSLDETQDLVGRLCDRDRGKMVYYRCDQMTTDNPIERIWTCVVKYGIDGSMEGSGRCRVYACMER